MPLLQVTYYVPEDTWVNLVTGAASRFGSVIRGPQHITSHLTEVSAELISESAPEAVKQGVASAKNHGRAILIGIGTAAVAAVATYWITKKVTENSVRKELAAQKAQEFEVEQPEVVATYNEALVAYLEAIKGGAMTEDLVSNLSAALDDIKQETSDGMITIEISTELSESLIEIVADYTQKLAKANSFDTASVEAPGDDEQNPVVELRHYLDVQKQIIDKAA